jgi:hypothetical protein
MTMTAMTRTLTIKTANTFLTGPVTASIDLEGFKNLYLWRANRQSTYSLYKVARLRRFKVRLQG